MYLYLPWQDEVTHKKMLKSVQSEKSWKYFNSCAKLVTNEFKYVC